MKSQEMVTYLLLCATTTVDSSQALLDFKHWEIPKTGENIGHWMENIHKYVGCKPEYIGSHTVDRASNSGASVDSLEWDTSDGQ